MKEVVYIEFASGWRPPAYRGIDIQFSRFIKSMISSNGQPYTLNMGIISDEDATYITLADPRAKIREVGENKK